MSLKDRPDTPYGVLTENPPSRASELTVSVCVGGLDGRPAGLLVRGFSSLGWLLLGRPSHKLLSFHRSLVCEPSTQILTLGEPAC